MARTKLQQQFRNLQEAVEREISRSQEAESDSEQPSPKAKPAGGKK